MENKERLLRLSDLFAMLLKSFVLIVCIALVFAVFGAARSISSQKKLNSGSSGPLEQLQKTFDEARQTLAINENSLKSVEEAQIPALSEHISWASKNIVRLQNHIDNSLLMALDPYACPEASMSFYLHAQQLPVIDFQSIQSYAMVDEELEVISSYRTLWPLDSDALETVRSILGIDAEPLYIREIATVAYNPANGFTEIKVCCSDTEAAQKAVDYLYQTLKKQLDKTVGSYQITPVGSFCGVVVDQDVKNDQAAFISILTGLTQELSDSEKNLSNLRKGISEMKAQVDNARASYRSAKSALDEAERKLSDPNAAGPVSRRAILRKAILFGLLGAFLSCVAVICVGLFGKTLQSHGEFALRYPIPLLGVLPRKRKYLFEKLIRRLEGEGAYSYDAAAQAAAQSLLAAAGGRSVCLTSSLGRSMTEEFLPYLDGRFQSCGDILGEADAVKALSGFDGVVLVEKRGKSSIDLIDSEVLRIKALGKEIIGAILT